MDYANIVQNIYGAFGRGDIPTILAQLHEDVDWEAWPDNSAQKAGVPWMQARKGPAGALEFFKVVGTMKFHAFDVVSLMAGGNSVAAEVRLDVELTSGARFQEEEVHVWTFDDAGKLIRFRHYPQSRTQVSRQYGRGL